MGFKGYTLVEVMLVLCLLMMIVKLGIGSIGAVTGMVARSELYTLYSACSYLQMRARGTNQHQVLTFDTTNNRYTYHGTTQQLPAGVVFGVLEGTKGPPSSPQHLITKPITGENQCITFTPHGIIQPGTVYIKTTDAMHMYALSSSVAQASFLRMYEYYNGAWRVIT